jgi:hypothetical protein
MAEPLPQIDTRPKLTPRQPATPIRPSSVWPWLFSIMGCAITFGSMAAWMKIGPGIVAFTVADDLAEQYDLLDQAESSQLELGMRAAAVAEACLQAKDRDCYKRWKAIADRHLRAANMPRPR